MQVIDITRLQRSMMELNRTDLFAYKSKKALSARQHRQGQPL